MKIMAVDFGDARTGLALCDKTEFLASPIGVIHEHQMDKTAAQVANAVTEYQAQLVVVGYPKNMNGTEGPRCEKCAEFAQKLGYLIAPVPVRLWDERATTVEAAGYLSATNTRGKKRKEVIDAVAATIILESFLSWRRSHPEEESGA